jgi:hypothetical protein
MNQKQIIILISALAVSALIVWSDLPLEFPGTVVKAMKLFVKLTAVGVVTIFAYIYAGGGKKAS